MLSRVRSVKLIIFITNIMKNENKNTGRNLVSQIRSFLQTGNVNKDRQAEELNRRAQLVSIGQIQYRDAYSPSGVHTGSYTQAVTVADAAPEMRPSRIIDQLGVTYLSGLNANFKYPLISGQNSEWLEECEVGDVTNTAFSSISLSPKRLFTYAEYDLEVLLSTDSNLQASIERDLINSVWAKLQETVFNGIFPTDAEDITSISDYEDLVAFELAAKDIENPIYLVSKTAASKLKGMLNSIFPVYNHGQIDNIPVIETNFLSDEKIILADWSRLIIGQWGALDCTVDNITKMNVGTVRLICNNYFDYGILDSGAFAFASTETVSDDSGEGGE